MRKFPVILLTLIFTVVAVACSSNEDTWNKYEEWRINNNAWLSAQIEKKGTDNKPYYTRIIPRWDNQSYVLIKYLNDTMLTKNNLKPLYTSTVDVKYIGRLYNDVAFDSSYLRTTPADSIFRTSLQDVVGGWTIALTHMHIGDSCEVIIPYNSAYGSTGKDKIDPYSNLKFNIKLVGIPKYVIP